MAGFARRRGTRRLLVGVVGVGSLATLAGWLSRSDDGGRRATAPAEERSTEHASSSRPERPGVLGAREGSELPPLRLVVLDEWEQPVGGVSVRAEEQDEILAHTDAEGGARVAAAAFPGGELVLERAGFEPGRLVVSEPGPDPVRVVLLGLGVIEGRAQLPADAPLEAREGIHVLAYPRGCRPCASNVEQLLAGDGPRPRLPRLSTTAADGSFRIDGLRPDAEYGLVAGGSGFVTTKEELLRPDGPYVELPMSSLYGAVVELRHADGTPVHAAPGVFAGRNTTWRLPKEARAEYDARSPMAVLAGMRLELAREHGGDRRLYLFTGATRAEGVGPIDTHLHVAGYEPLVARLSPRHLSEDEWWLPTSLELTPTAPAWGAVHVEVLGGVSASFSRELPDPSWGALVLRPETGDDVRLALWGAGAGHYDFDEVPAGDYTAWFQTSDRFARWPAWGRPDLEVSVGDGLPTVTVDLRDYGALELLALDEQGEGLDGRLRVDVTQLEGGLRAGMSGGTSFRSPPYVLPYLEAGVYRLDTPRTLGVEGDARDPYGPVFVVRRGEVTRLEVRLAERP